MEARVWGSGNYSPSIHQVFYLFTPIDGEHYSLSPMSVPSVDEIAFSLDSDWVVPEREITRILVESFKQVPEVASICAQFRSDGIAIWTLLSAYDRDAREAVYKREMEICDRLGSCDFDFRVSTVDLVSPYELVQSGSREIFRRS